MNHAEAFYMVFVLISLAAGTVGLTRLKRMLRQFASRSFLAQ